MQNTTRPVVRCAFLSLWYQCHPGDILYRCPKASNVTGIFIHTHVPWKQPRMTDKEGPRPSTFEVPLPKIMHIGTPPLAGSVEIKQLATTSIDASPQAAVTGSSLKNPCQVAKSKVLPEGILEKVTSFVKHHREEIDLNPSSESDRTEHVEESVCMDHADGKPVSEVLGAVSVEESSVRHPREAKKKSRRKQQRNESKGEKTSDNFQVSSTEEQIIGAKEKQSKRNARKRKQEERADAGDGEEKPKKPRPNYFVAVQITNPQIKKRLEHIQKYITVQQPKLAAASVAVPTAHLTLMVLHLNDGADHDDMTRARIALESCGERLQQFVHNPVHLQVTGLGNFRDQVVFAKVDEGEALDNLGHIAEMVESCFAEQELPSTDSRGFKPHITIMKMSKSPQLYKKGVKKIPLRLYEAYSGVAYGKQTVLGLQLCSMMKKKDEAGYYHVDHSVPLVPPDYTHDDGESAEDCSKAFDFTLPDGASCFTAHMNASPVFVVEMEKPDLQWDFLPAVN